MKLKKIELVAWLANHSKLSRGHQQPCQHLLSPIQNNQSSLSPFPHQGPIQFLSPLLKTSSSSSSKDKGLFLDVQWGLVPTRHLTAQTLGSTPTRTILMKPSSQPGQTDPWHPTSGKLPSELSSVKKTSTFRYLSLNCIEQLRQRTRNSLPATFSHAWYTLRESRPPSIFV